jgi:hypothetical protein
MSLQTPDVITPRGNFPPVEILSPNRYIYIDGSASYNGNGTPNSPFQTIAAAIDVASANSILVVAPGTYTEDVHLTAGQRLTGIVPVWGQNADGLSGNNDPSTWPILIDGDLYCDFPTSGLIGVESVSCSDVYLTAATPSTNCSLQANRCWFRDVHSTVLTNIRMNGSGTRTGNSDSIVRGFLGGGCDVELYGTIWGIDKSIAGGYVTYTSEVYAFQTIECICLATSIGSYIFASAQSVSDFIATIIFGTTIVNFTAPSQSLIIYPATRVVGGTLTVTGTGASIKMGPSAVGEIRDVSLTKLISVGATPGTLGFFSKVGSEVSQPTVSGSRNNNAALATLITALSNLGLINDSTTP